MVTKFDIEKFYAENYFRLWRIKMEVILIHQESIDAIKGEWDEHVGLLVSKGKD